MKTNTDHTDLLNTLKARFKQHMHRHPGMEWGMVEARLIATTVTPATSDSPATPTTPTTDPSTLAKLNALVAMEQTGGEPDVVHHDPATGDLLFVDCSKETPKGRRSLCYDLAAQASRKEHVPVNNAISLAAEMGVNLLDETQYRDLQRLEPFDTKTSSWILTPESIRSKGGALFGDRRYDQVFIYHNGADSYYAVRGFRACLVV